MSQGWFLLRTERENLIHASPVASEGLLAIFFNIPWLIVVSPRTLFSSSRDLLVCKFLCPNPCFLGRYQSYLLRAYPKNFFLNLINSVNTLPPIRSHQRHQESGLTHTHTHTHTHIHRVVGGEQLKP